MGLQPPIKKSGFKLRQCSRCGGTYDIDNFAITSSPFYEDGHLPICNSCITNFLSENNWDWEAVDKVCQLADIPFLPSQWEELRRQVGDGDVFGKYAELLQSDAYKGIEWGDYYQRYVKLRDAGQLDSELPLISEETRRHQRQFWGSNYDDEALDYLQNLYQGLLRTQNINGDLQTDQAKKICKISYEVDQRIQNNEEFDKLLSSYDKLVKVAEFTPKNVKNANDFETCGELVRWMERKGWKNGYYDNVTRDIVDETIKNIQAFNQRLYTNETGIGEDITRRIEMLKTAKQLEDGVDVNSYYLDDNYGDLDKYDIEGYNALFKEQEDDFNVDTGDVNV